MNPLLPGVWLLMVVASGTATPAPAAEPATAFITDSTSVASSPSETWPDTVVLSRGTVVRCRIVEATPESLTIEYPRRGAAASPPLRRTIAWSELQSASFSMDDEFHRLVSATDPAKHSPHVAVRWSALAPMVGRPDHPAGELALALARLSLDHPDASARHRALAACQSVATSDWNHARRDVARLYQARLLQALGRTDEAVGEARRLTEDDQAAPEAVMPAFLVLASADFAALRQLEDENPRWIDDDSVRPEREALFHRAVESALKPSLFDGAREETASQGLWTAVETLAFAGHLAQAAETARDLINLYPTAPATTAAREFLKRHRLPVDPSTTPEPTPEPPPSDASDPESAATTPLLASPLTTAEPVVRRRVRYAEAAAGAAPDPPRPAAPNPHPTPP